MLVAKNESSKFTCSASVSGICLFTWILNFLNSWNCSMLHWIYTFKNYYLVKQLHIIIFLFCSNNSASGKKRIKQVHLHKHDADELGMAILGGLEHGLPIIISEVFPNSAVGRCRKIYAGEDFFFKFIWQSVGLGLEAENFYLAHGRAFVRQVAGKSCFFKH